VYQNTMSKQSIERRQTKMNQNPGNDTKVARKVINLNIDRGSPQLKKRGSPQVNKKRIST
jgi:hypothetical protein